ncbi:MAG: hypothetical protein AB8B55_15050 [Mariniblastus sp.]
MEPTRLHFVGFFPTPMFRFTLKRMFIAIAIAGLVFAVTTQIGMDIATFEIWENDLTVNHQGLVQGQLRWGFVAPGKPKDQPWPFVCRINNVDQRKILKLKPKTVNEIRYRVSDFGPLKQQDPYKIYISQVLGIHEDKIVGFVMIKGRTEIIIDGS